MIEPTPMAPIGHQHTQIAAHTASKKRKSVLRFMAVTTPLLGGKAARGLLICYFAELVLLMLNPLDVMSPSGERYVVYSTLSRQASSPIVREVIYDIACWLTDHKKLLTYSMMAYWVVLFGRVISKPEERLDARRLSFGQLLSLARHVRGPTFQRNSAKCEGRSYGINRSIWFYLALSSPFVFLCSPAAMKLGGLYDPTGLSIFSAAPWNGTIYANIYYVAYRILNPLVVWGVLTHLFIGVQTLSACATRTDERKAGFCLNTIAFTLMVGLAHALCSLLVLDQRALSFVKDNAIQYLLLVALVGIVCYLLYLYTNPEPTGSRDGNDEKSFMQRLIALVASLFKALRDPKSAPKELQQVARELPVFGVMPLILLLGSFTIAEICWRAADSESPSIDESAQIVATTQASSTVPLKEDRKLQSYVKYLKNYSRGICPGEFESQVRAYLLLDERIREQLARSNDPSLADIPASMDAINRVPVSEIIRRYQGVGHKAEQQLADDSTKRRRQLIEP